MDQITPAKKISGIKFWFFWTIANTVAWCISLTLNSIWGDLLQFRALWLAGLIVGFFQWLVIRRRVDHSSNWFLFSFLGTVFAGFFIILHGHEDITLTYFFLGLALAQSLFLCRIVKRAWLWLVINAAAIIIAAVICVLPFYFLLYSDMNLTVFWGIFGGVAGGIFGAISGACLIWLLRYPTDPEKSSKRNPQFLSFVGIATIIIVVIQAFLFGYALWHSYYLSNTVICEMIKPGMAHTDVNQRLTGYHPIKENENTFSKVVNQTVLDEKVPYPSTLEVYGTNISKFYNLYFEDSWIYLPNLGLGYDSKENLTVVSSDKNSNVYFLPVQCPWTFQTWINIITR